MEIWIVAIDLGDFIDKVQMILASHAVKQKHGSRMIVLKGILQNSHHSPQTAGPTRKQQRLLGLTEDLAQLPIDAAERHSVADAKLVVDPFRKEASRNTLHVNLIAAGAFDTGRRGNRQAFANRLRIEK